jgi:hypothetical protein
MSQVIDNLCEDSGDNGERPLRLFHPFQFPERDRDKEESENGPVNKTAKGSAKFVVDLELADEVDITTWKATCCCYRNRR